MMNSQAQREHQWLQQLVGEWTSETEPTPQQPAWKGRETVRSIGELWTLGEALGDMPGGGRATMLMTLGFDPSRKKFVGTWVGSMMTHLWIYEGELDAAGRVLTLNSEGPSFTAEGQLAKYQDIIEIVSPDHRTLKSQVLGEADQWQHFMTVHYRRVKA